MKEICRSHRVVAIVICIREGRGKAKSVSISADGPGITRLSLALNRRECRAELLGNAEKGQSDVSICAGQRALWVPVSHRRSRLRTLGRG